MSFGELLRWTFWDVMRTRKVVMMAVLASVGPLFAIVIQLSGDQVNSAGYSFVLQVAVYMFTLVLLSIVFGCSAIAGEVTGRTIPYLVTRPVSRTKILLAKYVSAVIIVSVVSVLACLATAAIFGIGVVGVDRVLKDVWVIPFAAAVYCAVFVALSTLLVRPVLPAVFYTFAIESWVSLIPGDFSKLSILTYVRVLADHEPPDAGTPSGIFELLSNMSPPTITTDQAWTTLSLIAVIALTVGVIAFGRGEYVPNEEAA